MEYYEHKCPACQSLNVHAVINDGFAFQEKQIKIVH